MKKDEYGNSSIDFFNLTSDQIDKLRSGAKVVAEYLGEVDATKESIKDTVDDIVHDMDADKDSAAKVKKHINKIAAVIHKDNADKIRSENDEFETVLSKVGV